MTCKTPINERKYENNKRGQRVRVRGPSYPQQKPNGRYLSISVSPKGAYIRSYHASSEKAYKRLHGVPLHTQKTVIDTQPPQVKA